MRRVQRLFDNRYTPSSALVPPGEVRIRTFVRSHDPTGRARLARGAALLALGIPLLLAAAAAGAPVALADQQPTVTPWSHYDTGRVNVVFPSALPSVELFQDANASLSATLALAGVYEIDPTADGGPTVVAAAFPIDLQSFNGTTAGATSGTPILMTANLPVYPVGAALFVPGTQVAATGAPRGGTTLTVSFSPTTSTDHAAGVGINWTVTGWSAASGDLLALAFDFTYASGAALTACQGSTLLSVSLPECSGTTVATGATLWGGQYTSLEGEGGGGPVAVVSWGATIAYGTAATPVTLGAYASDAGATEFVLGSLPATGGAPAHGSVNFALQAPSLAPLAPLLAGDGLVYAGVGLVAALGIGVSVVVARRRDRTEIDEL